MRRFRALLLACTTYCLLLSGPAFAQDDDEDLLDDDLVDDDDLDESGNAVDSEEIYKSFKAELRGESPSEEIDAWNRYLDVYGQSLYRLEIEKRIEALDEAAYEELLEDEAGDDGQETTDAKRQEMDVFEPPMTAMNPNPRRRLEVGLLWGYRDYLNYQVTVEWALARQFSLYGGVMHAGRSFGGTFEVGAKAAPIKDVRTGLVMAGALTVRVGYSSLDRLSFVVEPWFGLAWLPNERFQVQTSLAFDVRLDRLSTWLFWDVMATASPNQVFGVYVESRQKHSLLKPDGLETQYLAFYQAGAGVKLHPTPLIEITVGANVPYFWRLWKDYDYFGVHADVVFHFGSTPER